MKWNDVNENTIPDNDSDDAAAAMPNDDDDRSTIMESTFISNTQTH